MVTSQGLPQQEGAPWLGGEGRRSPVALPRGPVLGLLNHSATRHLPNTCCVPGPETKELQTWLCSGWGALRRETILGLGGRGETATAANTVHGQHIRHAVSLVTPSKHLDDTSHQHKSPLQMGTLRHRAVQEVAQGHTAS